MKAAVVYKDFRDPPRYVDFPDPVPKKGEVEIEVVAAALHPYVMTLADGSHWYSPTLPFVPGLDGVGRTRDGKLVYFGGIEAPYGSMAERVVVDERSVVPLPDGADPVRIAAAVNLALVGWIPLGLLGKIVPGDTVLINGVMGVGAEVAVRLARLAGARVVVRGHSITRMRVLKADAIAAFEAGAEPILKVAPEGLSLVVGDFGDDTMWKVLEKRRPIRHTEFVTVGDYLSKPALWARLARSLPRLIEIFAASPFEMKLTRVPLRQVEKTWARHTARINAVPPPFARPAQRPRVNAIAGVERIVFVT